MFAEIRGKLAEGVRALYGSLPQNLRVSLSRALLPETRRPVRIELGLLKDLQMDISPRGERSYLFGTHEPEVQDALPSLVQKSMTVLDIGANIGFFALGLARLVGEEGRVIAFEPNAPSLLRLERNLELNHFKHVTIERFAVSEYDGVAHFSNALSDTQGRFADLPHLPPGARTVSVPCCTIDTYIANNQLAPKFILMDVEHAEGRVLKGMKNTLAAFRPILLVEMHGRTAIEEAWEQLQLANYTASLLPSWKSMAMSSEIPELSHCVCRPKN